LSRLDSAHNKPAEAHSKLTLLPDHEDVGDISLKNELYSIAKEKIVLLRA
jgi:hypothetical protein